jgi:hypothetical protein
MPQLPENPECRVPVNIILEAAHRLFSFDKVPFALALIHIVLEQFPDHPRARLYYEVFMGREAPNYPMSRMHRMYYDSGTGMFFVGEKGGKGNIPFKTLEEAERYLRELK